MSRRRLPPPPSVDELAELARLLAVEAPALLPAFVWCICRSSRAVKAYRPSPQPSNPHLVMLQSYPTAARLISSSQVGSEWLGKWAEMRTSLGELRPVAAHGEPDKR